MPIYRPTEYYSLCLTCIYHWHYETASLWRRFAVAEIADPVVAVCAVAVTSTPSSVSDLSRRHRQRRLSSSPMPGAYIRPHIIIIIINIISKTYTVNNTEQNYTDRTATLI